VIRGLLNYYGFVDNIVAFHSIINFFLHHSCAKTLARKLNLGNRAKVFKKFGRYLEAPTTGKIKAQRLYTLPSFKKNIRILKKQVESKIDPFEVTN